MKTHSLDRSLDDVRYRLTREIRENPLLCVGLAVGIGALLGAVGGRATCSRSNGKHWLTDLASGLGDEAHKVTDRAARAGRQANKELHSAVHRATEAVPDIDLDQLVSQGRRWLRSALS